MSENGRIETGKFGVMDWMGVPRVWAVGLIPGGKL